MENLDKIVLLTILLFGICSFIFEWMQIEVTALALAGTILLIDVIAVKGFGYPPFLLNQQVCQWSLRPTSEHCVLMCDFGKTSSPTFSCF